MSGARPDPRHVPIRAFLESEAAGKVLEGKPFAAVVCRRYWRHNLKTVRRLGTERRGDFVDGRKERSTEQARRSSRSRGMIGRDPRWSEAHRCQRRRRGSEEGPHEAGDLHHTGSGSTRPL